MNRREERETIFKVIFQLPFHENELPELVSEFSDDEEKSVDISSDESDVDSEETSQISDLYVDGKIKVSSKNFDYISAKTDDIKNHLEDIDSIIEAHSNGWKVGRLGKEELAILRVAVYEIKYDDDIPDRVAVNEAIELAKKYSTETAASFINGVLAGLIE